MIDPINAIPKYFTKVSPNREKMKFFLEMLFDSGELFFECFLINIIAFSPSSFKVVWFAGIPFNFLA